MTASPAMTDAEPPECTKSERHQEQRGVLKSFKNQDTPHTQHLQLGLSHFSLETPTNSRATSPRTASDAREPALDVPSLTADAEQEHEASINFELQFDILNHLPRDTAMALMDFLTSQQKELSKTSRYANELSRSNKELRKRLKDKVPLGRSCCWMFAALAAVLFGFVALLGTGSVRLAQPELTQVQQKLVCVFAGCGQAEKPTAQTILHGPDSLEEEGRRWTRQSQVVQGTTEFNGKIKETTVREMTLRETTTREYDPKLIQQLQTENLQMKLQLERLWLDIDDAEKKGQDHVCWSL